MAHPWLEIGPAPTAQMAAPAFTTIDRESEIAAMIADARDLGERWVADECDFCDVTLGVARHAQRLRAIELPSAATSLAGRALLSPMPGDQHSFAIALVAMRFREAGWDVDADVDSTMLVEAARTADYALIGLSVGHDRALEQVATLVDALRRASRRRDVAIALGGPMLNGRPDLALELGASVHADDAAALVNLMTPSVCHVA